MSERDRLLVLGSATGGLASSLAAGFAALCCVGPSTVALLGVGGALAAASLAPYRLLLLLVSFALIGYGLWRAYRPTIANAEGRACPVRAGRLARGVLWISVAVWFAAALVPAS
jgi:hypothetical protein